MAEATGELFRATTSWLCRGTTIQNVLHFRGLDGTMTSTILAGTLGGWYEDVDRTFRGNDMLLQNTVVQQLTPVPLDAAFNIPTEQGGTTGQSTPNNTLAAIITIRTGEAGRRKRGRIYLAGLAGNYFSQDTLSGLGAERLQLWCDSLMSLCGPGGAGNFRLGVYSRTTGGDGPTYSTSGFTEATSLVVRNVLGNQRRRRLGVGI